MAINKGISYIIGKNGITAYYGEEMINVTNNHRNYDKIVSSLKRKRWSEAIRLFSAKEAIKKYSVGKLTIQGNSVFYKNKEVHNVVVDKIIQDVTNKNKPSLNRHCAFLEKLLQNPSEHSVNQLYNFLQVCGLEIAQDGDFFAYKGVRSDWYDCHTGKHLNKVGRVLQMKREKVDDDTQACSSHGYHAGTESYARTYGTKLLKVKINPKDVVAVPASENQKLRTCRYKVVKLLEDRG